MVVCIGSARSNRNFNITARLGKTPTFEYFLSLRSKCFLGKFSRTKVGARAKKERGGEERRTFSPLPLFFFAVAPTFARLKHRNLPRERLLRRLLFSVPEEWGLWRVRPSRGWGIWTLYRWGGENWTRNKKMVWTQEKHTLIEKDHLGDWSPEKDFC